MSHFAYRGGTLHAEDVALSRVAEAVGTPLYCYSSAGLEAAYDSFAGALAKAGLDATVCFALKANSNLAVVRTLAARGAGADVVSGGELARALAAGVPAAKIVFSGVGKTQAEMEAAIDARIGQFNVESVPEIELLSEVASAKGATVDVAVRVNPNVDADTHHKISTGRYHDKFGIDIDQAPGVYARARALPGLAPVSIAVHIGSQLTTLAPFRAAFARVAELARALRAEGCDIRKLDLGGGLGIDYGPRVPPTPDDYARVVAETVGGLGCALVFEPGRFLVGPAGVLVTRVLFLKQAGERRFAIVDAAMNDLIRPALYDAWHEIVPVCEPAAGAARDPVDVVGPVCETGDTFATARPLPAVQAGELLVIRDAGAYGAAMASGYNSRALVPEILVRGDAWSVVRPRQDPEAQMALERYADWQA